MKYLVLFVALLFSSQAQAFIMSSCEGSGNALGFDPTNGIICTNPTASIQSAVTRSLNVCFQPSATLEGWVQYTTSIATTLSLTGGQTGTVFLEMSNDSACSAGTQELARFSNANTGTLTIGLNLTQTLAAPIGGFVPSGKWIKLRTANVVGTPTFAFLSGQETF